MIKKLFPNKFEHYQHSSLPPKASKILHGVAHEFMLSDRTPKHHEMAQANLHMRLYQQFGHKSSHIMPVAAQQLRDMLEPKVTS